METLNATLSDLLKAMEAGNYNAQPSSLVQGAAIQREDLSPKMENLCYNDKAIILQKMLDSKSSKSNTWQFVRQLSYGDLGGSAVGEGQIGPENTSDYARITVPMAYYVDARRVTEQAMLVDTFDGKKADERAAEDAGKKIAADVEFALFRGADDFSNGGVFDGLPSAIPEILPGMRGAFLQVRQAESQRTAQDLMFNEYGSSESVVFQVGGTLTQTSIEDSRTRTVMNHGDADKLCIDPEIHGSYNKISQGKERILLSGSAQEGTGAMLKKQWTANGDVELVSSRFLSGKTGVARLRDTVPSAAATLTATSTTTAGVVTPFLINQVYNYYVTGFNENGGEGPKKAPASALTIAASGDEVVLAIGAPASGTVRGFNVYRSPAGGSVASCKFIGRVVAAADGTATFHDQGNVVQGFVTGMLVQADTWEVRELAGFTRKTLAETNLSHPEVFYRFLCLAGMQPRKNVLLCSLSK